MIELSEYSLLFACLFGFLLILNEFKMDLFKNRSDENLETSGALALLNFVFVVGVIIIGSIGGMGFSLVWPFMLYALAILAFAVFRIKKLEIVIM